MGELLSRFVWPKYGRKSFVALLCKAVEVIGDLLTPLIIARMIDLGPNLVGQVNDALNCILGEPEKTFCSLDEKRSDNPAQHNEEVDELISLLTQKNTLDQDEEYFDSLASDLDADDFEDN